MVARLTDGPEGASGCRWCPARRDLRAAALHDALGIVSVGRLGGGSVAAHARPSPMKVRVSSSRWWRVASGRVAQGPLPGEYG